MSERIDPEMVGEVDGDQLSAADLLDDTAAADLLDEGFAPLERDTRVHWGETALEESMGESLDLRLSQELPDVWDAPEPGREADRAGRLEHVAEGSWQQDRYARDVGVSGGAASAEEAAMHTMTLEELQAIEEREAAGLDGVDDD